MTSHRFDRFTQFVAHATLSRRSLLQGPGAVALAAFGKTLGPLARAQDTPVSSSTIAADNATLFVQTAAGGTFHPTPAGNATAVASGTPAAGTPSTYQLTLTGHSGETIAFADRPQRSFGEVPTERFFASMGFTPVNPPNAALVVDTGRPQDNVLLVELFNPHFDTVSRTLTYEATVLEQYRGQELAPLAARQDRTIASTFGPASLFIDDCPALTQCGYYVVTQWFTVGPIPGEPFAMCWDPSADACVPCLSDVSIQGLTEYCNQAYPKQCGGTCQPA